MIIRRQIGLFLGVSESSTIRGNRWFHDTYSLQTRSPHGENMKTKKLKNDLR